MYAKKGSEKETLIIISGKITRGNITIYNHLSISVLTKDCEEKSNIISGFDSFTDLKYPILGQTAWNAVYFELCTWVAKMMSKSLPVNTPLLIPYNVYPYLNGKTITLFGGSLVPLQPYYVYTKIYSI